MCVCVRVCLNVRTAHCQNSHETRGGAGAEAGASAGAEAGSGARAMVRALLARAYLGFKA